MKSRVSPLPCWPACTLPHKPRRPKPKTVEFYNKQLNHYFIAATASESKYIEDRRRRSRVGPHGAVVPGLAERSSNTPADAAGVCRFYSSAANSHFYTPGAQECQLLNDQEAAGTPLHRHRARLVVRGNRVPHPAADERAMPCRHRTFLARLQQRVHQRRGFQPPFRRRQHAARLDGRSQLGRRGRRALRRGQAHRHERKPPPTTTNFATLAATWSGSAK